MKTKMRIKFQIKKVVSSDVSKSGWRSYKVTVNRKHVTAPRQTYIPSVVKIIVAPNNNYIPLRDDAVYVVKLDDGDWMVDGNQSGPDNRDVYIRTGSPEVRFVLDNVHYLLYKEPNLVDALYYSIWPLACYYNEITGEQTYDVILDETFDLSTHPDELIWAVFERLPSTTKANLAGWQYCIADFHRSSEAMKLHEALNGAVAIRRQLKY